MPRYILPKLTRLNSRAAVERLFERDASSWCVAYPLRAMWRTDPDRETGAQVQFMITIPKKKLRHAVDRVTMRRRVREAYRLRRPGTEGLIPDGVKIDIAFIYMADKLMPYHTIEHAMDKILCRVTATGTTTTGE